MIIRTYDPCHFEAVLALINAAAEVDRTRCISDGALRGVMLALGFSRPVPYETTALVFRESQLAGFAWWEVSAPHVLKFEGWVHPAQRRKGVGSALLIAVERFARETMRGATIEARSYQDIPGLTALFASRGYAIARRFYTMVTDLRGRRLRVEPPPGVIFRSFERDDLEPLVEADNAIFDGHWGSAPRSVDAWAHHMIAMRPHDPALWVLAWADDLIVAECLCHASREGRSGGSAGGSGRAKEGWVSVVGVQRAWRGRGLGRAILTAGLQRLQEAGYTTASLHVDSENIAAINLYRSLEMDVARTRLHFVKTVEAAGRV